MVKVNKFKCFVFLVFITIFLSLCLIAVEVAASFSVENLPKDTENSFIDNINLSLFLQEPEKQGITVFDVNEKYDVAGKTVLIVDDVKTSGATLSECGKMLYLHDTSYVYCLTAALVNSKIKEKNKKGERA